VNRQWKELAKEEFLREQNELKQLQIQAKEVGIVDVDAHSYNGKKYTLHADTMKLAIELTKKHAPILIQELEQRRKLQKGSRARC